MKIKDRFRCWGEAVKTYFVQRFRQFTPMRYIGSLSMFLVGIICFMYAVMFSVDIAKGLPFFTDEDGNAMMGYQIGALLCFYIIGIFLLAISIYEIFFQRIPPKAEMVKKDIVDGRVIEIKKEEKKDCERDEDKPSSKVSSSPDKKSEDTDDLSRIEDALNEDHKK